MSKHYLHRRVCLCLMVAAAVSTVGCDEDSKKGIAILVGAIRSGIAQTRLAQKMYQRPDWKAEEYFADPKVIRLCYAIQKRDLALIDKLIAEGADVNVKGVGNMTPLLWAFVQGRPWNPPPFNDNQPGVIEKWSEKEFDVVHLAIFTKLLEHGADPNVQFTDTFFEARGDLNGDKPHMAIIRVIAELPFPYFEAVARNGGDLHFYYSYRTQPTYVDNVVRSFMSVSKADRLKRLAWVITAGVDVNQVDDDGRTPLMIAVSGGDYDEAIMLIEAGADWLESNLDNPDASIIRILVGKASEISNPEEHKSYLRLIEILKEQGADFELDLKIHELSQIELGRMNINEAKPIREELRILWQQRGELYERLLQERKQQEKE